MTMLNTNKTHWNACPQRPLPLEHEFQKYEIKSTIYDMAVKRLKDGLKFQENEITEVKDHYLQCIFKCRMSLNS